MDTHGNNGISASGGARVSHAVVASGSNARVDFRVTEERAPAAEERP